MIRLTAHAQRVMCERGVSFSEVEKAVSRPQIVEPHEGRRRFIRGDLVVVVADDRRPGGSDLFVVTVLWRKLDRWTSDQMKAR